MEQLTQFINTVGFPIVACVFMYKQQIELSKSIRDLQVTLERIQTKLEKEGGEVKCYV